MNALSWNRTESGKLSGNNSTTYIEASMLCVSAYAVLYNWYFDLIVLFLLFISYGLRIGFEIGFNTILYILYIILFCPFSTTPTTNVYQQLLPLLLLPTTNQTNNIKKPYMLTYTTYIIYPQNTLENKLSIPKHINRLAYKIINRAKLSMINTK